MEKNRESAKKLTKWGDDMMLRFKSITSKRRKRDASKIRRDHDKAEINEEIRGSGKDR